MRRALLAWRASSGRSASTRRRASSTSPRTRARCSPTARRRTDNSWRRASPRAGAVSSWTAAATAYSVHDLAMLPFYIYYSMFGFQRVGDLIWAAADQRARGFLLGATAGRTTLAGEGLQHQDGASHAIGALDAELPRLRPRLRLRTRGHHRPRHAPHDRSPSRQVLLHHRHERDLRAAVDARRRRATSWRASIGSAARARILRERASGCSVRGRFCARRSPPPRCFPRIGGSAATSSRDGFSELAREAAEVERGNRLRPHATRRASHVARLLPGRAPIVAASDYVRAYPMLIAAYVEVRFVALGTDGFGRSDTRVQLRRFFEVDRRHIALAALQALVEEGTLSPRRWAKRLRAMIDPDAPPPWTC